MERGGLGLQSRCHQWRRHLLTIYFRAKVFDESGSSSDAGSGTLLRTMRVKSSVAVSRLSSNTTNAIILTLCQTTEHSRLWLALVAHLAQQLAHKIGAQHAPNVRHNARDGASLSASQITMQNLVDKYITWMADVVKTVLTAADAIHLAPG